MTVDLLHLAGNLIAGAMCLMMFALGDAPASERSELLEMFE